MLPATAPVVALPCAEVEAEPELELHEAVSASTIAAVAATSRRRSCRALFILFSEMEGKTGDRTEWCTSGWRSETKAGAVAELLDAGGGDAFHEQSLGG